MFHQCKRARGHNLLDSKFKPQNFFYVNGKQLAVFL